MVIAAGTHNTKLAAKILVYTLNAYTDWQITTELTSFFKDGKFEGAVTVPKLRAEQLCQPRSQLTNSYLIGLMYTQHMINGLVNYTYAQKLKWWIFGPSRNQILDLLETFPIPITPPPLTLIKSWWPIVFGNTKPIQQYAKDTLGYMHTLKPFEIARACLAVQQKNAAHNRLTAKHLRSKEQSPDLKIIAIRRTAQEFTNPQAFIESAGRTLHAAADWDMRLAVLLKLKYRMLH